MKKFSTSSASLANNNAKNCNSSANSSKITNKLIANQITNDIIRPKAISAAEAKLKNANSKHNNHYNHTKNYAKMSNDLTKCGGNSNGGLNDGYRDRIDAPTIETNEYALHLGEPSTATIEILSCASTNSSESSFTNSRICVEYATANDFNGFSRKLSCSNEYQTANHLMHRPKSSQSRHNPHKSPGDKAKSRKHYSPQHTKTTNSMYAMKKASQQSQCKKPSQHHAQKPPTPIPPANTPFTTAHNLPPSPPPIRSRYTEHTHRSDRHH